MRIAAVGSGRTVHALVQSGALARRGHTVRLVTLGPVLPAKGIEVCTRPLPSGLPSAVRAARGFFADLSGFAPDLLHLHYAGGRLGTLALLSGIRPLVVTVMGGDVLPEQHLGGLGRLERRATLRILEQADLLLARSEGLRVAIRALGDFEHKVRVLRWGVDETFRRDAALGKALRARLGLLPGDRVVVSPRILQPLYNVHLLVEAMPALLARVPQALLLVTEHCADPEYRHSLASRIEALGLEQRVRFMGAVALADMPALYSLAEAMVSVPASDGMPQTLYEAMACECAAVLCRQPSYAEAVEDGVSARLVEFDPAMIASALAELMLDDALRRRMTAAALVRVHEIAWLPREAERVEGYYRELLTGPRRRADSRAARLLDALSLLVR